MNEAPALAAPDWSTLVERVRAAEPAALEELYHLFSKGMRFYLYRHLGPQDLDDKLHDIFLIITQSIQKGELREPERLMGFVRTILRRQVAGHIDDAVRERRQQTNSELIAALRDHRPNPEGAVIERQQKELAMRLLGSIPRRDREVLIRFYLREQKAPQICRDMDLTDTQFRLIKSRAKARFAELAKARLSRRTGFLRRTG
jgi:RNA polymerase sigma-70 factor (ECF subfamily)